MSTGNTHTVAGIGELLWDIFPDEKQMGGAPANFAYHAHALGDHGIIVSSVGDDEMGHEIITRVEELGLDSRYITMDKEHPTGTVAVKLDESGKPDFTIHENVAWDFLPWNPKLLSLANKTDAVCFGSLCQRAKVSRKTINNFLNNTRAECIRVFDINLRQTYFKIELIRYSLELCNVLKLNDEELPVVANLLNIKGPINYILKELTSQYSLHLVALTRGASGSFLYAKGENSNHQGFRVDVVDTVGAGDSFATAMTLGLLHGKSLDWINEYANSVASFVCSESGATPKLPDSLINALKS
ncbi:carbohydrate kinase [candidate division WOR-3 bacterium]|nr:carbohydrate kinase [candidate division WOR-3 bacterium]